MIRADAPEFVILGAGAMGSIFGAHLARAGHSVAMLVREGRAQQIRADGLRLTGLEDFSVRVPVITDASQLQRAGVLIVAMKTLGTAAALAPLQHVRFDAVLSLQNGAFKNDRLVDAFGREAVLGALADSSGELRPDGTVLFTRNVMTVVGELDGGLSHRAQALAATIDGAGVHTRAVADVVTREWSKFCGWAGLMTMAVATRAVTWKFVTDPDGALLIARVVREVGALARSRGVELSDESILPIISMCRGSEAEAAAAVLHRNKDVQTTAPLHRISSLQDFDAGRDLELEETIAMALREARDRGIPMPVLDSLFHLCRALVGIRAKSDSP
ncbi:MAG: ketopantoate reductase family protein [Steroidobacteraceae bacterium]